MKARPSSARGSELRSDPGASPAGSHRASVADEVLQEIARTLGTPTYVYDARALDEGIRRWIRAVEDPARIWYSVKANSNRAILYRLRDHGVNFEVATSGEYARLRTARIPPARVLFGGVPKRPQEVRQAMRFGVDLLVLQAEHEVEAALEAADAQSDVRIGLRVRPGIRAGAHPSLETGAADAKFGFLPPEVPGVWERLAKARGVTPRALAVHLGSGLDSPEPYGRALDVLLELVQGLEGTGVPVEELDLGGGLGIAYDGGRDPEPADVVARVRHRAEQRGLAVRFEPGRSVVAGMGLLLTRVLYRCERGGGPALVCDAAFSDFSRYVLYGARHRIEALGGRGGGEHTVEVLGATCESGDVIGRDRPLHGLEPGDLLCVADVGAYGFTMASNYNSRRRPAEVLVEGDRWDVVRSRERFRDLWRGERLPGGD